MVLACSWRCLLAETTYTSSADKQCHINGFIAAAIYNVVVKFSEFGTWFIASKCKLFGVVHRTRNAGCSILSSDTVCLLKMIPNFPLHISVLFLCRFIGQLLRLLVCNNEKFGPQMQKHVKELIGQEMSAQLYPLLFDQIRGIVEKFFDQQGQV